MISILENFKENFNLANWLMENLLWSIFFVPSLWLIWFFVKSIKISCILIKNNRMGLGTGAKLYLADRFIEIWYKNDEGGIYTEKESYSPQPGFLYAYIFTEVIDKKLEKLGLVNIDFNPKINKKMTVRIKSITNQLVIFFVRFYQIHFMSDGPDYYKNLKK